MMQEALAEILLEWKRDSPKMYQEFFDLINNKNQEEANEK